MRRASRYNWLFLRYRYWDLHLSYLGFIPSYHVRHFHHYFFLHRLAIIMILYHQINKKPASVSIQEMLGIPTIFVILAPSDPATALTLPPHYPRDYYYRPHYDSPSHIHRRRYPQHPSHLPGSSEFNSTVTHTSPPFRRLLFFAPLPPPKLPP